MNEEAIERMAASDAGADSDESANAPPASSEAEQKLYGAALVKQVGLWTLIKEDFKVHNGGWTRPGLMAIAVYRFGTWRLNLRNPIFRFLTKIPYWFAFRFVRNFYGIEMQDTVKIGRRLLVGHQHGIVIHAFATIGDDCIMRHGVTLGISNRWERGVGPVVGDRVSFGVGVSVMGNVVIGDDVFIGPNAVISANIPSNRTVFAPQARSLPRQFNDGNSGGE